MHSASAPFLVFSDQLSENGEQPQVVLAFLGQFKHHLFQVCVVLSHCRVLSELWGVGGTWGVGGLQVNVLRFKRVQRPQSLWYHLSFSSR